MSPSLRRATVLAVAAVVLYVVVSDGRAAFADVPLITGLGFLLAAAAGGARGPLWAPGVVVTSWGLANVLYTRPPFASLAVPQSAAHMVGIGVGLLVLTGLARAGVAVSASGTALAVLLSGLLFAVEAGGRVPLLDSAAGYALVLLGYAAAEVLTVGVRRR